MDILTTIIKEYPNNITLNSLADKYHFSAIYMSRLIKKETGYSFMDILTGIRLMRAAKMLEDGKEKVQDICEKTGFSNQRYFSQAFKKIFDCTPSEYRKKDNVKRYDTITDMLEFITVKRHIKDEEEM
nr:helix-turn-helix transcriptional regulator [Aequitasia blattaphilus]